MTPGLRGRGEFLNQADNGSGGNGAASDVESYSGDGEGGEEKPEIELDQEDFELVGIYAVGVTKDLSDIAGFIDLFYVYKGQGETSPKDDASRTYRKVEKAITRLQNHISQAKENLSRLIDHSDPLIREIHPLVESTMPKVEEMLQVGKNFVDNPDDDANYSAADDIRTLYVAIKPQVEKINSLPIIKYTQDRMLKTTSRLSVDSGGE